MNPPPPSPDVLALVRSLAFAVESLTGDPNLSTPIIDFCRRAGDPVAKAWLDGVCSAKVQSALSGTEPLWSLHHLAALACRKHDWLLLHHCFAASPPGELDILKFTRGCCRFSRGYAPPSELRPESPGSCSVTGEECPKFGCDVRCDVWNRAVFGRENP